MTKKEIIDRISEKYINKLGQSRLKNNKVLLLVNSNNYEKIKSSISDIFNLDSNISPKTLTIDNIDYEIIIKETVKDIEIYQLITKM